MSNCKGVPALILQGIYSCTDVCVCQVWHWTSGGGWMLLGVMGVVGLGGIDGCLRGTGRQRGMCSMGWKQLCLQTNDYLCCGCLIYGHTRSLLAPGSLDWKDRMQQVSQTPSILMMYVFRTALKNMFTRPLMSGLMPIAPVFLIFKWRWIFLMFWNAFSSHQNVVIVGGHAFVQSVTFLVKVMSSINSSNYPDTLTRFDCLMP